jgi:hypothetical protein
MGVGRFFEKLFRGDEPAGDTVVRAYGKLPMYAEYRRLEVAPGTATLFSRWMDEGRLAWAKSPTRSPHGATRPTRLMVRLPETKEAIIASVWDSRDSLGRVFPFAFFVVTPIDALGANPLVQWTAAASLHRAFDRMHGELSTLGTGGDFYRHYAKRSVPLRGEDLEERVNALYEDARQVGIEEWFGGLGLDKSVTPAAWFDGLMRRADRWRAQPPSLAEAALSCPLAAKLSYGAQLVVWLQWIGPLLQKSGRTPWIVMPAENSAASSVTLLIRDLLPDDFQLLTSDADAYGYVEKLAAVPAGAGEALRAAPGGGFLDWVIANAPTAT